MSHHDARRYAETTLADARALGVVTVADGDATTGAEVLVSLLGTAHQDGQAAGRAEAAFVERIRPAAEVGARYTIELPAETPTRTRAYGSSPGAPAAGGVYATAPRPGDVALWELADPDETLANLCIDDVEALLPLLARLVVDHRRAEARRRQDEITRMSEAIHTATHTGAPAHVGYRCSTCRPAAEAAYDARPGVTR